MTIFRWFYQWGSMPYFYRFSDKLWPWLVYAAIILILAGWIWGLAFTPADYIQKDSFRIIYVHVPAAFLAQSIYLLAAISGFVYLVWRIKLYSLLLRSCIPAGTIFTILALVTGSIWGKPTWGAYWVWGDARLLSVVVLLFFYLSMVGLDQAIFDKNQANKAMALLALVGVINIPVIQYSVEWWFTLHQPASFRLKPGKGSIAPVMLWPLLFSILGHYLFAAALILLQTNNLILQQEHQASWLNRYLKKRDTCNIEKIHHAAKHHSRI